jgi:hypothetical protein
MPRPTQQPRKRKERMKLAKVFTHNNGIKRQVFEIDAGMNEVRAFITRLYDPITGIRARGVVYSLEN